MAFNGFCLDLGTGTLVDRDASGFGQAEDPESAFALQQAFDEGFASATRRFSTIVAAEGIKGNSRRMMAAAELAAKSDMAPDDAIAYVVATVPEDVSENALSPDQGYERGRLAGLVLAGYSESAASAARKRQSDWDRHREAQKVAGSEFHTPIAPPKTSGI